MIYSVECWPAKRKHTVNTWFQRCIPVVHVAPSWHLAFLLIHFSVPTGLKPQSNLGHEGSTKPRPRRARTIPANIDDDVTQLYLSQSAWPDRAVPCTRYLFPDPQIKDLYAPAVTDPQK
ncbi:hypothetical protein AXF42_Ash012709 [Apostasia shenzhenica]|uniref:Uncharacterized protein n=1 Tax=Apostasia shenzhenica TaxID=1088818 RepID=A0A2H9ZTG3_9ASPA|nr:hypothetical protein AXF42_Ash012709 [Apostasia shenzhenica]